MDTLPKLLQLSISPGNSSLLKPKAIRVELHMFLTIHDMIW